MVAAHHVQGVFRASFRDIVGDANGERAAFVKLGRFEFTVVRQIPLALIQVPAPSDVIDLCSYGPEHDDISPLNDERIRVAEAGDLHLIVDHLGLEAEIHEMNVAAAASCLGGGVDGQVE